MRYFGNGHTHVHTSQKFIICLCLSVGGNNAIELVPCKYPFFCFGFFFVFGPKFSLVYISDLDWKNIAEANETGTQTHKP